MLATRRPSFFPLPSPIILLFNSVSQLWVINSWRQRATYRQMSVSEPRAGRLYFEGVNHCIDSPRSRNRCHCKFYSRSHLSASDILWGKGNCFELLETKISAKQQDKGLSPSAKPCTSTSSKESCHRSADPTCSSWSTCAPGTELTTTIPQTLLNSAKGRQKSYCMEKDPLLPVSVIIL